MKTKKREWSKCWVVGCTYIVENEKEKEEESPGVVGYLDCE